MLTVWIAAAAGVGAVARYLLDRTVSARWSHRFPLGTFAVNVSGSLVLGLVTGLALHHGLDHDVTAVLGIGFAGGYTTFSTWAWECLALGETGAPRTAVSYGLASFAAGLAAAAVGLGLALL